MSVEKLPVYPDLFSKELPKNQIPQIEERAREQGHLDKNEGLLERITMDKKILDKHKLDKMDIYRNHRNMFLLYNLSKKIEDRGVRTITLNGQDLKITCKRYMGAETCPIEKSFDSTYHGFSRGSADWDVKVVKTGKEIRFGDLLAAQVGMFGFCQSPSSSYRLDLEKYIDAFGLKGPVELFSVQTKMIWSSAGGSFGGDSEKKFKKMSAKFKIIKNVKVDGVYKAIIGHEKQKRMLFNIDSQITEQKVGTVLDVDGLSFTITKKQITHPYCLCWAFKEGRKWMLEKSFKSYPKKSFEFKGHPKKGQVNSLSYNGYISYERYLDNKDKLSWTMRQGIHFDEKSMILKFEDEKWLKENAGKCLIIDGIELKICKYDSVDGVNHLYPQNTIYGVIQPT